jgi:hypothetical protein
MMPYSSARCHGNSVLFVEEIPSRTRGGYMGLFLWIPRIFTDVPGLCARNPSSTPDSPTGMADHFHLLTSDGSAAALMSRAHSARLLGRRACE